MAVPLSGQYFLSATWDITCNALDDNLGCCCLRNRSKSLRGGLSIDLPSSIPHSLYLPMTSELPTINTMPPTNSQILCSDRSVAGRARSDPMPIDTPPNFRLFWNCPEWCSILRWKVVAGREQVHRALSSSPFPPLHGRWSRMSHNEPSSNWCETAFLTGKSI